MEAINYTNGKKVITETIGTTIFNKRPYPKSIEDSLNSRFIGKPGHSASCERIPKKDKRTGKIRMSRILPETTRQRFQIWDNYIKPIEDPMHKALFSILLLFGCRISEALALKKRDFWIQTNNQSGKSDLFYLELETHKNKSQKERSVPISYPQYQRIIDSIVFHKNSFLNSEDLVFPISYNYVWRLSKIYFGYKYSPHWFRHHSASTDARRGSPINLLQKKYGWAGVNSCDPYIHLNSKDLADWELKQSPEPIDVRPDLPEVQPLNKKKPESEDWW